MLLNARYLSYLSQYPLLTKSVTAAVLSGLNETLASLLAKDIKRSTIKGVELRHVFSAKILTMMFYGAFIVTPTSHYLYGVLNKIFKGPNLSVRLKVAQIVTSLCTITPLLSAIFTSWLSLINNYAFPSIPHKQIQNYHWADVKQEVANMRRIVLVGLRTNYAAILKSSVATSLCTLVVAQNFVEPELWVVFFNAVYFVLGTYQNTKLKLRQPKPEQKDR